MPPGGRPSPSGWWSPWSPVHQGPAGEAQEHVLEGAAPDQRRDRRQPPVVHRLGRLLAVVRVKEHSVREQLDPLGEISELAVEALGAADVQAELPAPPTSNRTPSPSGADQWLISSRGEPSATIRAWSMTTSRSQSCSASS